MQNVEAVEEIRAMFAEHERMDQQRFDELIRGQRELRETVTDIEYEVGGAPKFAMRGTRQSLKDRVHYLESTNAAAEIARSALQQAQEANRQVWTRLQKTILFGLAIGGFIVALATFIHTVIS